MMRAALGTYRRLSTQNIQVGIEDMKLGSKIMLVLAGVITASVEAQMTGFSSAMAPRVILSPAPNLVPQAPVRCSRPSSIDQTRSI